MTEQKERDIDTTKSPEDFTTEDLSFAAHDKIDVLLDILIEKGILTEKEYLEKLKAHYE